VGISSAIFQYQLDKELNARIKGPEAKEVGLLQARKTRFSERGAYPLLTDHQEYTALCPPSRELATAPPTART